MQKNNFNELIRGEKHVESAVREVVPRLEESDVAEELGITEHQLERLEKKVHDRILSRLSAEIRTKLIDGEAVEFPDMGMLYVHESTGYTNENGNPKKSLKARTRKQMHNQLNNQ